MKRAILTLLLISSLGFYKASAKESVAHIRIINTLNKQDIHLEVFSKKGGNFHKEISLGYAQPMKYMTLKPDHYIFKAYQQQHELLQSEFVLGKNGYYTLCITGIIPEHPILNEQTTDYTLKKILGGETKDDNGNLPQWLMLRDNYDGSAGAGYIRMIHLAPTAKKGLLSENNTTVVPDIAYAHISDMKKLSIGEHPLELKIGESKVSETLLRVKPGMIYTLIIADTPKEVSKYQLTIMENPSKTKLNQ